MKTLGLDNKKKEKNFFNSSYKLDLRCKQNNAKQYQEKSYDGSRL